MLSYSTGTSGTGADVDKVRAATELVRQREPDLLVDGPIQYDAAVDPTTAATKMPDSKVAGRATVLIFPDLNTGNNTYKAVQRSAGAIAIGPGAAGTEQTGQRPVARRADRGHRQHRRDHRDPGAGQVMAASTRGARHQLRLVVVEIRCRRTGLGAIGGRRDRRADRRRAGRRPRRGAAGGVRALAESGRPLETLGLVAVGHRVVHGGPDLYRPTLIDDALIAELEELAPLAPLHNPPAVLGIEVAREALPDLPHIAVFDTAFFHDLPPAAATYAIDRDIAAQWHIRRYGFHGTSHQYVSEQAAAFLDRPLESLNQIVLHLGNGASASAIAGGKPVDTSMGLTPLEGLVMGTRSGDIDPGIVSYLSRTAGMSVEDIETMLNRRSGVLGLGGEIDFRVIAPAHRIRRRGSAIGLRRLHPPAAQVHRRATWRCSGGTDVITFTAGVGENDAAVRRDALSGLASLGIELDDQLNDSPDRSARRISSQTSPTTVLVIPTDEELAIARACLHVIED